VAASEGLVAQAGRGGAAVRDGAVARGEAGVPGGLFRLSFLIRLLDLVSIARPVVIRGALYRELRQLIPVSDIRRRSVRDRDEPSE
jgi:hypothetical protein